MSSRMRDKSSFGAADFFQGLIGSNAQIFTDEETDNVSVEKDLCKICGNTRFIAPKMILLTAPCCHRICDSCTNRIYSHGGVAPCPLCQQMFKRRDWAEQNFDNLLVERECRLRKQLSRIYNKRQDDFATLSAYNDYLEEIEALVSEILANIQSDHVLTRIEAYRQGNEESIARNAARQSKEDKVINAKVQAEKLAASKSLLHQKLIIDDEKIDTRHESMVMDEDEAEFEAVHGEKEESVTRSDEELTDNYSYDLHYEKRSRLDDSYPETVDAEIVSDKREMIRTAFGGVHPERIIDDHVDLVDSYPYDPLPVDIADKTRTSGYLSRFSHLRALESCFSMLFTEYCKY